MTEHVEFDEPEVGGSGSILYGSFRRGKKPPTMVRWVMKTGIVKTPRQANLVLIAFIAVGLMFSGYILFFSSDQEQEVRIRYEDLPPEIQAQIDPKYYK